MTDDFFAVPTARRPESLPAEGGRPSVVRRRPMRGYAAGAVAAVALVVGAVIVSHRTGPVDSRPIVMPATVNGLPMFKDQSNDPSMRPVLTKIFGSRPAADVTYATIPTTGQHPFIVVAGRGPITKLGDVTMATADRERFGDISCGRMVYEGSRLGEVCWYSSPTLGVSINFLDGDSDPATDAQVVTALVPVLRDGSGG